MSIFTRRCNLCGGSEETVTDSRGNVVCVYNTCTCHNNYHNDRREEYRRWVMEDEAAEAAGIPPADLDLEGETMGDTDGDW